MRRSEHDKIVREVRDDSEAKTAELRAAVETAELALETERRSHAESRRASTEVASIARSVLCIALMLENKANAMPIRDGRDAAAERALRVQVEELRALVLADDEGVVSAAVELREELTGDTGSPCEPV